MLLQTEERIEDCHIIFGITHYNSLVEKSSIFSLNSINPIMKLYSHTSLSNLH